MVSILSQYCINVSDIDRAIEFWEGVVGIPVVSRTEIPSAHEAILQSPAGGSRMQLAQHLDHGVVERLARLHRFDLRDQRFGAHVLDNRLVDSQVERDAAIAEPRRNR